VRGHRRRGSGYLIAIAVTIGAALIATFVFGHSYSHLALQQEPFRRLTYVPSFDPVEDVTLGLPPDATNRSPGRPEPAIRGIAVYPTQTILLAGGHAVRTIDHRAPATLHGLVRLVHDRSWLSQSGRTIRLSAAVILERSSMTVAAPLTAELVMSVRRGVFLAAVRGQLHLSGVYVHASDPDTPRTFSRPEAVDGRPFLLASEHAVLTARHCVFRYLGRDWNSSYGLSWSKESTGYVTHSEFDHDFIGVYSNDSTGLRISHNRFSGNSLYGIDPHSGSSHLTIEYNIADSNGRHGIIFSDHVTDSVVRYNVARGNGLNGIMMDEASAHNTIAHNIAAQNRSGGIVIANSSDNAIIANAVRDNRVGIMVRGRAVHTTLRGNTVTGNSMAAQGTGLAGNTAYGNGGVWLAGRIALIWLGAAGLLVLLLAATRLARGSGRQPAILAARREVS
jgi:mannuronan 5-epimerase